MKRIISCLLTVALLFGMLGTTGMQVFADTPELELTDSARLEGIPAMIQVGPAVTPEVSVAQGDCYVTDVQWMTREKEPVTAFAQDQYYYLAITLETETHVFSEYLDTWAWDTYAAYQDQHERISDQKYVVYYIYRTIYAPNGFTESALVSMTKYYPGDAIPALPEIFLETGIGSNLTWTTDNGEPLTDTVFEEDKEYRFSLTLTAPEGYPFMPGAIDYDSSSGICGGGIYYEDDYMSARVSLTIRPNLDSIGSARIAGVPWDAEAGPATAPEIYPEDDHITVGRVFWTDMEKNPITTLETGKTYYLAVEVFPAEGHRFGDGDFTDIYTDGQDIDAYDRISRTHLIGYIFYSLEPDAGTITVDMSGLAEGGSIADYAPIVSGNATLKEIIIRNVTTGQLVTDGVFEPNTSYRLDVVLQPFAGYRFNSTNLQVHPYRPTGYGQGDYTLSFTYNFSTCQIIDLVEVSVVPPVPGGKISDAVATVDPDAPYTIKNYYWLDSEWNEVGETFEADKAYDLMLDISPKSGYAFDGGETSVYVNGEWESWNFEYNGKDITLYSSFDFQVRNVYLEGMPYSIKAGTAKAPTVEDAYKEVTVSQVRWVDSAKSKKVTSFTNGKVYYLELTLKPNNGKFFNTQQEPYSFLDGETPNDWKYKSNTELVLYYKYSLEPDVGAVTITPSKLAVGTKISEITAAFTGKLTLVDVTVMDYDQYSNPAEETLEANRNYYITYTFAPKSGYRLGSNTKITLNTDYNNYCDVGNSYITLTVYFSTCQKISEAQVTLDGVEVGKNIADAQPVVPEGAPYTASIHWFDSHGNSVYAGTFQDGEKYEGVLFITPAQGYILNPAFSLTFNGKTTKEFVDGMGTTLSVWKAFSFRDVLEKVEIPALPTSIKKGQTLPTDFAAPADAPYTIYAEWGITNEGSCTTVTKNGPYLLYVQVYAKDGYEFSSDTKVYVDGQLTNDYIPSGESDITVLRLYNVGMTEIRRIDLTATAPNTGATPAKATISSTAKYTLEDCDWLYALDDDINNMDSITKFEKDTYTYLCPTLFAKDGYSFASDVAVYINGVKVTALRTINGGTILQAIYPMGLVGDAPTKLSAPAVTVSDNVLTWEANGADAYEIYRATSKSGTYKLLETITAEDTAATFALRAAGLTFVDETAAAGKTYYYKVKAISAAGTKYNSGYSSVSSIAYAFDAPTISVEINETTGKTVISWEKVSGAKSYDVYRATEPDGTYTKLGNTKSNTYTDTKAAAGINYYYKVVTVGSSSVYNSEGSNIYMSYARLAQPTVKVSVDKATGKPSLTWAAIADAVSYRIYRQLENEAGFTMILDTAKTSFIDSTAPLDTLCTYYIEAAAADESCDSIPSNIVTATVALGVPTLTTSINKKGQPTLSWQAVEGAVEYEIYRSTKSTSGFTKVDTVNIDTVFVDENATVGKTYYYKVIAKGEVSASEYSAVAKLVPTCAVPTVDMTTDQKTGRPKIFWEKVTGAKSYDIYYATSENGTYKKLTNTKSLSYTDTKLAIGAIRYYKVRAVGSKSAYNSAFSASVSGNGFCAQPQVKITLDAATGKPTLSWSKISGASSYRILRIRSGYESDFADLDIVTGTSFIDTTAPVDTTCFYMVQALHANEGLSSAFSPVLEITAGIARPTVKGSIDPATGNFVLTWDAVEGAKQYEVYRSTKSNKSFVLLETLTEDDLRFENTSAPGKTYYYRVIAVGAQSRSATPTALKLVGKCQQPVAESYTDAKTGKPVITWEKVSGAKKYDVYRATVEGGKFSKLGTTTKTSYTDTKASAGKVYYYKVVAVGSSSAYNSAQSNATAATACAPARPVISMKNDSKTGKLTVSWKKVTGATYYTVCYVDITEFILNGAEPTEEELEALMLFADTPATSFTFADADPDTVFAVTVVACTANDEICSDAAEGLVGVTNCAAPKITGLLSDDGKPAAWWNEVEGAEGYVVYRSTKSSTGFKPLGIAYSEFFIDDSAVKGKTYYYKITAIGELSESAYSNVVKLKSK